MLIKYTLTSKAEILCTLDEASARATWLSPLRGPDVWVPKVSVTNNDNYFKPQRIIFGHLSYFASMSPPMHFEIITIPFVHARNSTSMI